MSEKSVHSFTRQCTPQHQGHSKDRSCTTQEQEEVSAPRHAVASSGQDATLPFHLSSLILTGKCTTLICRERCMALGIRAPGFKLVWEADGLEIDLLPLQGLWTEEQYLRLTDQTNRFIEFTEGSVEILPLPTRKHQAISRYRFFA